MTEFEYIGGNRRAELGDSGQGNWEAYRNHRDVVTNLLLDSTSKEEGGSLCVFGAGPSLDLSLVPLCKGFGHITLVDIQPAEEISKGVAFQGLAKSGQIGVMGDLDLFGLTDALQQYQKNPNEDLLDQIIKLTVSYRPPRLKTYNCVASTCMLSQLMLEATSVLPSNHARFVELLRAIRRQHLLVMLRALKPGGFGVLFTDFVSSESVPELIETQDLQATLNDAISKNNFLHGLNPAMVVTALGEEVIQDLAKAVLVSKPWRWAFPDRVYACFAIHFQKR